MKGKEKCWMACSLAACMLFLPLKTARTEQNAEIAVVIDDGMIAQGVKLASVDVSNLSASKAQEKLASEQGQAALGRNLVLVLPYGEIPIPLSDISAVADTNTAVQNALMIGRNGGITERMQQIQQAKSEGIMLDLPYIYDEQALLDKIDAISNSIPRENVAGTFEFDPNNAEKPFIVEDGHAGFTPDTKGLVQNVKAALGNGDISGIVVPGIPSGGVPVFKTGTAANTVKIASFTTHVSGSSGRISNIKTGAGMLNGKVVQPGETFSVNGALGPRTKSYGIWKKAPTNVDGRHENDYGGGLCQVSTTLFNAVIRADLEIVQWVHHTIPSTYVQIGCDATVSTGGPDFRFRNNTQWPVYILMHYDTKAKKLTAQIFGRPLEEGVKIELIGKKTGTKAMPATQYTTDPDKIRKGRQGKYSETYKVWYKLAEAEEGKEAWVEYKRELIDKFLYPAFSNVVLKSTADPVDPAVP